MARRVEMIGVAAVLVAVAGLLTVARGRAADPTPATTAAVPRAPGGDPDLQGIWTDPFQTPLQRPARYAGKETFTDEERAALDQQRAGILRRDQRVQRGTERDVAGAYNAVLPVGEANRQANVAGGGSTGRQNPALDARSHETKRDRAGVPAGVDATDPDLQEQGGRLRRGEIRAGLAEKKRAAALLQHRADQS